MNHPSIPSHLPTTTLDPESLQSHEEYTGLRLDGGSASGLQAEQLILQQIEFQETTLDQAQLYAPKLTDVRFRTCSLVNTNCERITAHRVELIGCRLTGLNMTEGYFQHVLFRNCDLQLAGFRFCKFKTVVFEECNLKDANFQGADLSGVDFQRCDLSNTEMSHAKLVGTDFRTSKIEGLRVGAAEVVGAVVDHFQAAYMASLLGLIIKSEHEE